MSWKEQFNQAVKLNKAGRDGNRQAVVKAYQLLREIRTQTSSNLVEAYYGNTVALLGRDAADPMDKFNKVQAGLKILDRCVAKEPSNVEIRGLRGFLCLNIPKQYFNRASTAVEDLSYLISRYEKDSSVFSSDFYKKVQAGLKKAKSM